MTQRLDFYNANPNAIKALLGLEKRISESSLEKSLVELIQLPRLPDQRLRLLHRPSYCGRAQGRERTIAALPRCPSGAKHPSSQIANARRWPGPKPSRSYLGSCAR
jgi:hypothetical protein